MTIRGSIRRQPAVLAVVALVALLGGVRPAVAASTAHDVAQHLSNEGILILMGAAVLEPSVAHKHGRPESIRVADGIFTATLASELLKHIIRERRPDGSRSLESFPSGHATAAFAAAMAISHYFPKQAPFWFLGATAIAWSRVEVRAHHTKDVIAGALLGSLMGHFATHLPHGLILGPLLNVPRPDGARTTTAMGLTWSHAF